MSKKKDNEDYSLYIDELEYSKPADELLEAIKQRLTRLGEPHEQERVLKIANKILESRP